LDKKILLFIPTYNCEKQIVRVMRQIDYNVLKYVSEIIIVNNLSTDNTENIAVEYAKQYTDIPFTILKNESNYNLGGSHKVAFKYAIDNGFDYVIVLHGDDQANINDIMPLIVDKAYMNYDVCLGARFMKGSKLEGYSLLRTIGNYGFNTLYSIATGRIIYDLGSGINMFSISALKDRFYFKVSDGLGFNNCMLLIMCFKKFRIKFFPITWREKDQISNLKLWDFGLFNLNLLWKYFFDDKKFVNSEMRTIVHNEYQFKKIYTNLIRR